MKRHEAISIVSHRTSDLEFIHELYDKGYQISKVTTESEGLPPKSKFMEEYFENVNKVSESHWNEWLAKLIDKHKADK